MSEIIGLIELVRTLVQRREELDKQYLANFIEPAWQAFKAVHESYKHDYDRYIAVVKAPVPWSFEDMRVQLMGELWQDATKTADLRIELIEILRHTPLESLRPAGNLISNFATAVVGYFDQRLASSKDAYTSLDRYKARVYVALMRTETRRHLARADSMTQAEVLDVLQRARNELQHRYEKVAESYHEIRKNLLT